MKKFQAILTLALTMMVATAMAIPAKSGQWRTVRLADGTQVKVELKGDEHIRYWQAADGRCFSEQADGTFAPADMQLLQANALKRHMARAQRHAANRAPRNVLPYPGHDPIVGQKKGIIILVEFANKQFDSRNDRDLFDDIANVENYQEGRFYGSVHDYFNAQSNGKFDLTFDVLGPVLMENNYQYYGNDVGGQGYDAHAGEMTATACQMVDDLVDFKDYDWNDDGEVDQVFIIYAGKGQADGGGSSTIWPHEWSLTDSDYGQVLMLDGMTINTYACGSELNGSGQIDGIGTICHEFSHCLGFPDLYDIKYGGNFGMGSWDLMDGGCYNGGGFVPSGYSSYEKWVAGWLKPHELTDKDVSVENLVAQSENGEAYIIVNPDFENEYYILENRQREKWDRYIPGSGLLIHHVDYDPDYWAMNVVNTTSGEYSFNTHERCTIVMANNSRYDGSGQPFPYGSNNSLTSETTPNGFWYNVLSDASATFKCSVVNIARNDDATVSFRYLPDPDLNVPVIISDDELLFAETFDGNEGIGGNDNRWSGEAGSGFFLADYKGWKGKDKFGANQCVKIGTESSQGEIYSPEMLAEGEHVLTFKAAPWGNTWQQMVVSVMDEYNRTVKKETFPVMARKEWTEYELPFEGSGVVRLRFTTTRFQFFLDDVKVVRKQEDTGIREMTTNADKGSDIVYSIDGRRITTPVSQLSRGIYLINGRRVIIK